MFFVEELLSITMKLLKKLIILIALVIVYVFSNAVSIYIFMQSVKVYQKMISLQKTSQQSL